MEQIDAGGSATNLGQRARAAGELVLAAGTVLGVVGGALVGVASPAGAATTHVVDSTADDGSGGTTLREAIEAAVAGDTITFDLPVGSTISLVGSELSVDKLLTIQGPGAAGLTIDAAAGNRAFYLYSAVDGPVTITGLTISGGDVSEGDGGGIYARQTDVVLDDVVVDGNQADGDGGGLAVQGGSLDMTDSAVTGNDAGGVGGGIVVKPSGDTDYPDVVSLLSSTISGNTAVLAGGGASVRGVTGSLSIDGSTLSANAVSGAEAKYYLSSGGGLVVGDNGATDIIDTTISGNTVAGMGGGVSVFDMGAPAPAAAAVAESSLVIERTTISGNDALNGESPGFGGGIMVIGLTDALDVVNSTVSGNTAALAGGGVAAYTAADSTKYVTLAHSTIVGNSAGYGGGVWARYEGASDFSATSVSSSGYSNLQADHTIVAGNAASESGPDVFGGMEAAFSLVGDTSGGTVIDEGGNLFDRDANLGPLADNGGATMTHLPDSGSPVVDAGDPSIEVAPDTDQRGMDRITGSRIDMGSVEGSGRAPLPVGPCSDAPQGAFSDVTSSNVHHAAVDCLAHLGITEGGPEGMSEERFGPALEVTRGQMATFLARLIAASGTALPSSPPDAFGDDVDSPHEPAINALVEAGVIEGFSDGTFRPGDPVRRDQMASFLRRTHDYISDAVLADGADAFDDDEPGNVHEAAINALANAGVIEGTGTPRVYDPSGHVRRDQMASFLIRLTQLLASRGEFPS